MKIYLGENTIAHTKEVSVNHIPLAYISEQYQDKKAIVNIEDEFCQVPIEENVYPYQAFDKKDISFFDENYKIIESAPYMKRNGDKYYFEPKDSIEFIPTEFAFSVIVNRSDTFKSSVEYKMNIASFSERMAEMLIGIFSKNNKDKPINIHVNKDNHTPMGMLDMSYEDADILFLPKDVYEKNREYAEELLDKHVNIWIVGDDFENAAETAETEFTLENPKIYNNAVYTSSEEAETLNFDFGKELKSFPKSTYEYISLFKTAIPALILKKENSGFIVMSGTNFIKHTDVYGKLILEISMLVYLNTYFQTKQRRLSITDNKIDYFVKMYQPFNQNHTRINLEDILYEDEYNLDIDYDIVKVLFDREDIRFLGTNKYRDLLFKKTSRTDPVQKNNTLSIYTINGTIVNYDQSKNVIKVIEDKLRIESGQGYISIEPYRSTRNNVNLEREQNIIIPDDKEYVLFWTGKEFDIVNTNTYDIGVHGVKFATLKLSTKTELKVSDLREYGGGECHNMENYEMIDTGALEGRPYRIGSTMVIKLPERFRDKKEIILNEVKEHISSADIPILLFED